MKSSILNTFRLRSGISIGFSWYVGVFLMELLVTATRCVGQEIQNMEGQGSEFVVVEQDHGRFQVQRDLNYHYDPHNRREPFLPLVVPHFRELGSASIEESGAEKPTWKLLGIISGLQGHYASIQSSDGKRYIVTSGSVIPSEGLRVNRISNTELELDSLEERNATTHLEESQRLIVSF